MTTRGGAGGRRLGLDDLRHLTLRLAGLGQSGPEEATLISRPEYRWPM
jgi:hypothetical protein